MSCIANICQQRPSSQTLLNDLNYNPGTIDGQYGEKTKDALVRFYDLKNMKFGVE
ncbi:MAG: peptidoglycan-binding domain-containing protein [Pseudomonadales bacterium]